MTNISKVAISITVLLAGGGYYARGRENGNLCNFRHAGREVTQGKQSRPSVVSLSEIACLRQLGRHSP